MAKLSDDEIKDADSWTIQDGLYEMQLYAVETTDRNGNDLVGKGSGHKYWRWVFEFPEDANEGRYKRRRLDKTISLGDSSRGMRIEAYEAFGVPYGSETDDIVKDKTKNRCIAYVKKSTFEGKEYEIGRLMPLSATSSNKGAAASRKNGSEEKSKY